MKVVSFFWQFVLGHPLFWARFTGLRVAAQAALPVTVCSLRLWPSD